MQYALVGGIGAVVVIGLGCLLSWLDMGGGTKKHKSQNEEPKQKEN